MSEFTYTGVDRQGQKVTGKVEAPTEGDLRMILRGRGIRPTRIDKTSAMIPKDANKLANVTVPVEHVVLFSRQLQLLISSGVPLLQGLTIMHEQQMHPQFKEILGVIKDKVAQGSYFWESLSPYPRVFSKLFVALIRAGESSGSLDQMLKRLSRYLEEAERLKKMVKSAMFYPALIMAVGLVVIALMLIFVIPKFEEMLASGGQELPLPTQLVINLSHFMSSNFHWVGLGAFAVVYLLTQYLRTPEGRATYDRILFSAPGFGPLVQKAAIARFCRTLQTLLTSGVNIIDAIDICRATIDNYVIEEAVKKMRAEVEAGKTVGMVAAKFEVFPKMVVQMITVGETTGNLDKMLEKIADFYDQEIELLVAGLTKMVEPLILVFLGGTIGGLMIAMYLPIFKLAGGVSE